MAGTVAEPEEAKPVDATAADVSEKKTPDLQTIVDLAVELANMNSRDLESAGASITFNSRFDMWSAAVSSYVANDEAKHRRVGCMITYIKQKTLSGPAPAGKWKPMLLAMMRVIEVPDNVVETCRRDARMVEAKITEALAQSDLAFQESLQSQEAAGKEPEQAEIDGVVDAARTLIAVHTGNPGGVSEFRLQREVLVGLVRSLPHSKYKSDLEGVLEYQKMRFRTNSMLSWKPPMLAFLRRAGASESEVEKLRDQHKVPLDRDIAAQEAVAELLGSSPLVGAAAHSSGGTLKPAGSAEAAQQDAGTPPPEGSTEAGTAVNSNGAASEATAGSAGEPKASAPQANVENGGDEAELPYRPRWKKPHFHGSANAWKICFIAFDGLNKTLTVSAKQMSSETARGIARLTYLKALETDGDEEVVRKYRDELVAAGAVPDATEEAEKPEKPAKKDKGEKNEKGKENEKAEKDDKDDKAEKADKKSRKADKKEKKRESKKEVKDEPEGPPAKKVKVEKHEKEDAPPGHDAHHKVKYAPSKKYWYFFHGADRFQVSENQAFGSSEDAGRICRLCYVKFTDDGWAKEQVLGFRKEHLERLELANNNATPAASPAVRAASQSPAPVPAAPPGEEGKKKSKKRKKPDTENFSRQEAAEVKRLRASGREFDLVRMHGRDEKKKNSALNGLYAQTEEGFGGLKAYEKAGSSVPRFLLYSAKRGRWLISDSASDAQKGFAYAEVKDGGAGGPFGPGTSRWFVFDGKEQGYTEDPAVQCTAILSGEAKVEPKTEVKEETAETAVKVEQGDGAGEPQAAQSDTSSSDDSDSEDDSDDSSSDSAEAQPQGGQGALPEQPLPQEAEKPAPQQPVLHTAKGRVCAKMLVRSLLRCPCHFAYLKQCPDQAKARA